jgi:hypothetical protein
MIKEIVKIIVQKSIKLPQKMKKIFISSLSVIALFFIVLACSKDRSILLPKETLPPVEEVKPLEKTIKDFNFDGKDAQAFLNKIANKSDTKTISSQSDLPFIAKNGTKIWIYSNELSFSDGSKASYPFDLEVLELLTPKDMILNQKPTVAQGRLLTTGGELFIKATKGGKDLSLSFVNNTTIEIPANNPLQGMSLFYGNASSSGFIEWYQEKERPRMQGVPQSGVIATDSIGRNKEKQYVIFPTQIGWINVDKFTNFAGAKTKIKFTSAYPALKEIQTFLFFPDLKSVMQVYGETSGEIPVGQLVKVISIAVTKDEQIFSFIKDVVIAESQVVNIELQLTTQKGLNDYLQSLTF